METLRFVMVTTHYPPQHVGGDAMMVKHISSELTKRGHEVNIFYDPSVHNIIHGKSNATKISDGRESEIKYGFSSGNDRLNPAISYVFGRSGKAVSDLTELCDCINPDVIHWHNTKAFIDRPIHIRNEQSVYTAHDYYLQCPRSNRLKYGRRLCVDKKGCQFCLIRCKRLPQIWRMGRKRPISLDESFKLIAPCKFMADQMEMDGIGKAEVIYNFVPDEYSGERRIDDDLALTYVGIMEPHKGPQTLLEAFARSREHQGFALNMIGDGSLRPFIAERVRTLGLEDRVHVRGYVKREELNKILAECAAQIIPSQWYENNPLTAIEAFSHAIPVLGSRIGGLPEIINEKSGSHTFEAGDIKDQSEKLIQLWTERDKLSLMSGHARNAYQENFTPEKHIDRYLQTLNA